jgi:hypothetical protein
MADPYRPPVSVAFPATADEKALHLLSIFHYVVAGLVALFASIFIAHIVIGVHMMSSPDAWMPPSTPRGHAAPFPPGMAVIFVAMGSIAVLLGWTMAVMTALAGRFIARRRRHVFCLIVAGLLCLWMPFGTVLGVFTLITLTKPHVRAQFETPRA